MKRFFILQLLLFTTLIHNTVIYAKKTTNYIQTKDQEITINNKSKFSGNWKFSLSGANVEDEVAKNSVNGISASMNLDYKFFNELIVHASPRASFKSGHAQSLYGEFEPKNSIGIDEAGIKWNPHEYISLNGGILSHNQDKRIGNPYLINNAPFPGLEANIHLVNYNKIKTDFILEEALPTSYTQDSDLQEMEETPRFNAKSIKMSYGEKDDLFFGQLYLTNFAFENLPSVVAEKSRVKGNTVTDGYHFDYEYAGNSASTKLEWTLVNSFKVTGNGYYLKNSKAPVGYNVSRSIGGKLSYTIQDTIITPGIDMFYNEPDSTPAYYSSYKLGTNNRQGYDYNIALTFNNLNMKITWNYIDSNLIYKSPFQSRRKAYSLKLETLSVKF